MASADTEVPEEPKKSSKLPMVIGLVLALAGGGGAFFAIYSGMILAPAAPKEEMQEVAGPSTSNISFLAVEPMVISVGPASQKRHLRFRSQLEVPTTHLADVEILLPRVVDVLNTYLRALRVSDLEDSAALVRLRTQMLRRVRLVVGDDRVNDLLIMEFVLN
ncbi:flagellar basal body-associated FliL family protein [Roseobacteraceae bacterium S113]